MKFLVIALLKTRMHESLLGLLWVLVNPIVMFIVHLLIFQNIFIKEGGYALYLFTGFMPWLFIKISHDIGVSTLSYKLKALKSLPLTVRTYNFSSVLENYTYFLIIWIMGSMYFLIIKDITFSFFIYSLLCHIPLIIFTCTSVHLFALLNVHLKDIKHILDFILKIFFLFTPILYSPSYLKDYHWSLYLNPIYYLIRPLQEAQLTSLRYLLYSLVTALFMMTISFFLEKKLERNLYHNG